MRVPFKTKGDDPVDSIGDLQWPSVQAVLATLSKDSHTELIKLEIRKKQNGFWRVIVKGKRKENYNEKQVQ